MEPRLSSTPDYETEDCRWWFGPGADAARARHAIDSAVAAVESGAENLKRGRRKQLYRIDLGPGHGEVWLKANRYDRGVGPLRRLRTSKSRRELAIAVALAGRGVETPVPIAAGEIRSGRALRCCYLLVPHRPGAIDFAALESRADTPPRERSARIAALGRTVRRMHDAGLLQHDLAPNNFLVETADATRVLPIDFERARLCLRLGARARSRTLAKLDRRLPGASSSDRMRFLLAYTQGDAALARRWWRRVLRASAAQARHDAARLRRHAGHASRRVQPVGWGDWEGWAMRDAPELAHLESIIRGADAAELPAAPGIQIEAHDRLWCRTGEESLRASKRLWANAELLALRGLGPRPIALLRDGEDRTRLWLARDASTRSLLADTESSAARAAAVVLIARLLALGRVEPWLGPRKLALSHRPDGGLRALLIDPGAFRCARTTARNPRSRARRQLADRLAMHAQLREIVENSPT